MSIRPRRRRATLLGAGSIAALLAVGACGGLPVHEDVTVVRPVPPGTAQDAPEIRKLPAGPPPGASPEELVRGFLEAAADPADTHALARSFLAPGVAWQDGAGVTVYEPSSLKVRLVPGAPGGPAVVVAVQRRLQVDPDGGYRPAAGPVTLSYGITAVGGQWRIRAAPPGILLTSRDVERSYAPVVLEALTGDRTLLVPDPVLLPVNRTAVPAATMRYLLRGPTRWLAPAVTTALPAQVQLLGTATLDAGTVTVDLSPPAGAVSSAAWAAYTSQVRATMAGLPGVTKVRLLLGGREVSEHHVQVPRADELAPATSPVGIGSEGVVRFDPAATGTGDAEQVEVPGTLVQAVPVALPATEASAGASRVAVVVAGDAGVLTPARVAANGSAQPVARPGRYAAGTWLRSVGLLTVRSTGADPVLAPQAAFEAVGSGRVPGGTAEKAPPKVTAPGLAGFGPVTALAASADGARAVAVAGFPGDRRLYLGRAARSAGSITLSGWTPVTPIGIDVSAVAWSDALNLVVLGASGGRQALWRLSLTSLTPWAALPAPALPCVPTSVAAAPQRPILIGCGGRIWSWREATWVAVAAGDRPAYP
ncbi:MAG: GerMN domain-containing protein [Frankiaceae bacterium]